MTSAATGCHPVDSDCTLLELIDWAYGGAGDSNARFQLEAWLDIYAHQPRETPATCPQWGNAPVVSQDRTRQLTVGELLDWLQDELEHFYSQEIYS